MHRILYLSAICFFLSLTGCGERADSPDSNLRANATKASEKSTGGHGAGSHAHGGKSDAKVGEAELAPPSTLDADPTSSPAEFETSSRRFKTSAPKSAPKEGRPEPGSPAIPGATPAKDAPAGPAIVKPDLADPVTGTAGKPRKKSDPLPAAGQLTAGSFDDNTDPRVFAKYVTRFNPQFWQDNLPARLAGTRVQILVKDSTGKPIGGAKVKLTSNDGAALASEIITRPHGLATFVLTWDGLPEGQPLTAHVTPPDGSKPVVEQVVPGSPRWDVTLPTVQAQSAKQLDLAFIIDTTGSMGDELKYVQGEIKGISADLKKRYPDVQQRFSFILFRDQGDEYVTRMFDFTDSVEKFQSNLAQQRAGGGGDYPEAVHKGLEQAQQLRWNHDANTVRLAFLVGDAPPHNQYMRDTFKAMDGLRRAGVGIYPVACSGYDDSCEMVWRSSAILTSSQFLFLTDDSGIGGAHAEPKIPYYQVEHLNQLMTRLIASEILGQRIEASPNDVIRTVGRKVN